MDELLMRRQFLIDRALYTVAVVPLKDEHGEVDLEKKQIRLNDEDTPQEMLSTLIHELIHAIDEEYMGSVLEEWQVRQLERGIYRFLKDNFMHQ